RSLLRGYPPKVIQWRVGSCYEKVVAEFLGVTQTENVYIGGITEREPGHAYTYGVASAVFVEKHLSKYFVIWP
ncbi:MAG: hypothetical protein ABI856_16095, partial [Nitrospira sp.]